MAATALLESLDTAVHAEPGQLDAELFEIVDGQRIEVAPMSAYAAKITTRLATEINIFAWPAKRGEAVVEVLFRLPLTRDSSRNRRPDAAFVSSQRWPSDRPQPIGDNAWDVVPDLAVEVISPTDSAEDLLEKVKEYFQAGVHLVWLVYPSHAPHPRVRSVGSNPCRDRVRRRGRRRSSRRLRSAAGSLVRPDRAGRRRVLNTPV